MDLKKLISGSDVRGRAMGEDAPLTPRVATCLGMAFARFLAAKLEKPVAQDFRRVRELSDIAKSKGLKTKVGLTFRYAP